LAIQIFSTPLDPGRFVPVYSEDDFLIFLRTQFLKAFIKGPAGFQIYALRLYTVCQKMNVGISKTGDYISTLEIDYLQVREGAAQLIYFRAIPVLRGHQLENPVIFDQNTTFVNAIFLRFY
jgi:hypothetical protein